jgi:hypothetical protein
MVVIHLLFNCKNKVVVTIHERKEKSQKTYHDFRVPFVLPHLLLSRQSHFINFVVCGLASLVRRYLDF